MAVGGEAGSFIPSARGIIYNRASTYRMNATATAIQTRKVWCPAALAGLGLSLTGFLLSILGTHGPKPFGAVRFPLTRLTGFDAILVYGGTFLLPIALGALGAGMGAYAFQSIDRSKGRLKGDGPAVFAVLVGIFTIIIAGITSLAILGYPAMDPAVFGNTR